MLGRLAWCLLIALAPSIVRAEGRLETIRQDVRTPPPDCDSSDSPRPRRRRDRKSRWYDRVPEDSSLWDPVATLAAYVVVSPFCAPYEVLEDDFDVELLFQRFPYDECPGYMHDISMPGLARWSGRLSTEYGGDMDDLELVGGRLLVETASRWGMDVQMERLGERLSVGGHDELWIGDGNLVYRFAQGPGMQWRTGIGINWLDDGRGDDLGLNFTYGVDWYPRRPWVLSATLDWGTLGHAELFRFRTTAGVLVDRFEPYIGYEYLDIDRTQTHSFLAGLQIWF